MPPGGRRSRNGASPRRRGTCRASCCSARTTSRAPCRLDDRGLHPWAVVGGRMHKRLLGRRACARHLRLSRRNAGAGDSDSLRRSSSATRARVRCGTACNTHRTRRACSDSAGTTRRAMPADSPDTASSAVRLQVADQSLKVADVVLGMSEASIAVETQQSTDEASVMIVIDLKCLLFPADRALPILSSAHPFHLLLRHAVAVLEEEVATRSV